MTRPHPSKSKPPHSPPDRGPSTNRVQTIRSAPNRRRALSHVGGEVVTRAPSADLEARLRSMLDVTGDERATMRHVHGFHSYPARLHPQTAARAIQAWSTSGQRVLDPFCGSGTVLVEARLAGRVAVGNDANPLAVELSWLKSRGSSDREREAVLRGAQQATEVASERRRTKSGASRRYPEQDVELFAPHILLELDGLRVGLEALRGEYARRALMLVLSATLTKVSQRVSDSTRHSHSKRIAAGFVSRFFMDKARELVERLAAFSKRIPPRSRRPEVYVGDARRLAEIEPESIDLVVSSPPYPGVYDYLVHHQDRLRWLGLPDQGLAHDEIGSRRQLSRLDNQEALRIWTRDFGAAHRALQRVLRPEGRVLWVIADSVVGREPLWADEVTTQIAKRFGFEVEALASQHRPYFHQHTASAFRARQRREHVLVLRRDPKPRRRIIPGS